MDAPPVRVAAVLPGVEEIEARVDEGLLDGVFRPALGAARREAAGADDVTLRMADARLVVDDVEDDLVTGGVALVLPGGGRGASVPPAGAWRTIAP